MNYIFFKFYKYAKENGNYAGPEFTACTYFSLFLLLHLWILAILLQYWGIADAFQSSNKNIVLLSSAAVIGLVYLYFYHKKRYSKIIDKYNSIKEIESKNIFFWCYVGISIITPFLLAIFL